MREGATTHILAGYANLVARRQDAGVGECLGEAPVNGYIASRHLLAIIDHALNLTLQNEVFRQLRELLRDGLQVL